MCSSGMRKVCAVSLSPTYVLTLHRLKTTLNLPPVEPRPPLAPRLYSKLYAYLEGALTAGTPRKRQKHPLNFTTRQNGIQKSLPQRHTPTKEKALENWRNANRAAKDAGSAGDNKERDLPNWVLYVIRLLCRQMQTRKAIPHVIAGVESVYYLSPPTVQGDKGKGKEGMKGQIPSLIAAVWFFVSCRMLGKDLNGDEYVHRRNVVMDVFEEMADDETLKYKLQKEKAEKMWEIVDEKELRLWMNELVEEKWVDMDWFMNIRQEELDGMVQELDEDGEVQWYSTRSKEELRKAGLGSMITRQYDFLSEENRLAYKQWKKMTLIKVEEMIRDGMLDQPASSEM